MDKLLKINVILINLSYELIFDRIILFLGNWVRNWELLRWEFIEASQFDQTVQDGYDGYLLFLGFIEIQFQLFLNDK